MKKARFLVLAVGFFIAALTIRNIADLVKVQERLKQAQARLETEKQEYASLQRKKEQINTVEFIESQARNKLGFAKEGEVVVVLPDAEFLKGLVDPLADEESIQNQPNWKQWQAVFFED